jgi:hypothetical protein
LPSTEPVSGDGGWSAAVAKAKTFVGQLTIDEKVNLTTGVDLVGRFAPIHIYSFDDPSNITCVDVLVTPVA